MVQTLEQQVDEIRTLLEIKLRVRGKTFDAQIKKAGRLLPRAVRRDVQFLSQSVELVKNPKLARMVDPARAQKAHGNVVTFLNTVDRREQQLTALINVTASIAFVVLVTAAVLLYVLVQRGFV